MNLLEAKELLEENGYEVIVEDVESLENERSKIEIDSMTIRETMPTIEEQIKAAQANVTYYKKLVTLNKKGP